VLTTNLRKVGGSTMFAVPAELLKMLHLQAGDTLALTVQDGRLVAEPRQRPRYTMAELLAVSDYSEPQSAEERGWVDAGAVGQELL
jgi:antitoxin ChpS